MQHACKTLENNQLTHTHGKNMLKQHTLWWLTYLLHITYMYKWHTHFYSVATYSNLLMNHLQYTVNVGHHNLHREVGWHAHASIEQGQSICHKWDQQRCSQHFYRRAGQTVVPRGTSEVHLVFNHPRRLPFNPKDCEHKQRYGKQKEHAHVQSTLRPGDHFLFW